ncbi:hypothetical protein LINPERPRIM_LOCUS16859 [Linum perenne]
MKTRTVPITQKEKGSRFSVLQQQDLGRPSDPRIEEPASGSFPRPEEDAQLIKLKEVLDAAMEGSMAAEKPTQAPQTKHAFSSRTVLQDISNDRSKSDSKQGSQVSAGTLSTEEQRTDPDAGLFQVPVMYQNPTFQSQIPGVKAPKPKSKALGKGTSSKEMDLNPIPTILINKKRSFKKAPPSSTHGMLREWDTMLDGAQSAIRDGFETLFWRNKWVDSGVRLLDFAITSAPGFDLECTVALMTDNEGQWDYQKLERQLVPEAIDIVTGMSPPQADKGEDDWVWGLESSGRFSIRSAYNLICETDSRPI